jgi:2-C-methyl-D-erythritol 4-phosphate cytidylyltransferase
MPKYSVILPAAGQSSRFKDKDKKPFAQLDGRAVWLRSAELFITREDVCQCLVVVAKEDEELFRRRYAANLAFMNVQIVPGGKERGDSVANALAQVKDEAEFVAIHDAVRPCLTPELVSGVFAEAARSGAAILAVRLSDTLKKVGPQNKIESTLARDGVWLAQTPQVFRKDLLLKAYASPRKQVTDDSQLVEALGQAVSVVEGDPSNIKVATKGDLFLADAILRSRPKPKGAPLRFGEEAQW